MILTSKATYIIHAAIISGVGLAAQQGVVTPIDVAVLDAIGVSAPLPYFLAGMCFAIAGAFVSLAHTPPDERATKWATLVAGVIIGLFSAIIHPHMEWLAAFPLQAVMGISGLMSRKAVDVFRLLDLAALLKKGGKP